MRFQIAFYQALVCLLLVVAAQVTIPTPAIAADGFATRMPANAIVAISIADSKDFWAKTSALSVTSAIERLFNSPANANNLDYQEFQLQLQKLSAELGYPASIEEFLGNVFNRVDFYMLPSVTNGPTGSAVLDFGIVDKTKVAKLIEVVDKKNAESQKVAEMSVPKGAESNFTFEKIKLAGLNVSHFIRKSEDGTGKTKEGYYGIVDERFLYATTADGFTVAASGNGQSLAQNGDFSRLAGQLPVSKSDLVGWVDADAILQSGGMGAMLSQMPGISPSNKTAFTAQIGPNMLISKVVSTADPAQTSDMIEVQPLQGLNYIVPNPVAATVTGTFDPDLAYGQMSPMFNMMGGMGGTSPFEKFEQAYDISIQNDLVPAMDSELFFALNGVAPNPSNPFLPMVDLLAGCKVRDEAKMAEVLKKMEAGIEAEMAKMTLPQPAGQPSTAPKFQSTTVGDAMVRSLALGLPGISLSYSIANGYLVVGLTAESVSQALQRANGQLPTISQSDPYRALGHLARTNNLYSFSSIDMVQLVTIFQPYLPLMLQNMPAIQGQVFNSVVGDVLTHFGRLSAMETQEAGLFAGYMTVEMR